MSQYGKPTSFNFGNNRDDSSSASNSSSDSIHNFDPDKQGNRTPQSRGEWYGRSDDTLENESSDSLVSEIERCVSIITKLVQEKSIMISYGDSGKTGSGRGGASSGIPRLKMENMSFEKRTARILAVREEQAYGESQVIVKVAFANSTYLWYLKKNNPNLKFLVDTFGADENKWIDEEFFLFLENDTFNNRNTVRTAVPEKGKRK